MACCSSVISSGCTSAVATSTGRCASRNCGHPPNRSGSQRPAMCHTSSVSGIHEMKNVDCQTIACLMSTCWPGVRASQKVCAIDMAATNSQKPVAATHAARRLASDGSAWSGIPDKLSARMASQPSAGAVRCKCDAARCIVVAWRPSERDDGGVTHTEPPMQNARLSFLMFAVLLVPVASPAQEAPAPMNKTYTLSSNFLQAYQETQRNLSETAEKMPEESYGFRPTPEIRPFGQLVAHVALAQFRTCAMLKGEADAHKDDKEDATRSKADLIALLKASTTYCDPAIGALTDATMTELLVTGKFKAAKGLFPAEVVVHGAEMYGVMTVYLRLKGLVPPSTEKMNKMKANQESK